MNIKTGLQIRSTIRSHENSNKLLEKLITSYKDIIYEEFLSISK
jgi:hypothetical protein